MNVNLGLPGGYGNEQYNGDGDSDSWNGVGTVSVLVGTGTK